VSEKGFELPEPLRGVFERSAHPMLVVDDDRHLVAVNDPGCRLLRYSREQLLELRIDDITPEEHRQTVERFWADTLAGKAPVGDYDLLRGDGTRIVAPYSAIPNVAPGLHLGIALLGSKGGEVAPRPDDRAERGLTRRERQVLRQIALGATSEQAAGQMGVSPETARTHVRNAMEKLGARTRAQAIALALKRRLIDADPDAE
jgi:PAS domain S-box-containing protein